MQTELLRTLLLEYLRTGQKDQYLQFNHCVSGVTEVAIKRCPNELGQVVVGQLRLRDDDASRLKHVIWDLILERVLVPGPNSPNQMPDGWPFLSVTDHGRKVLAEQRPVPYDPDGYLAALDKATGGLHPSAKKYLEESISTFCTGNRLASAVMLGAASEMVFLELCEAIAGAIKDVNDRTKFEERTGSRKKMVDRIAAVTNWLNQKKAHLPAEWQRQEQVGLIEKIADLIRNRRNEAGHPQDPPAIQSHEQMYAMLMLFPHFCENLYQLKQWLLANPLSIT
jgi:hypothetical protein